MQSRLLMAAVNQCDRGRGSIAPGDKSWGINMVPFRDQFLL